MSNVASKLAAICAYVFLAIAAAVLLRQLASGLVFITLGQPWLGWPTSVRSLVEPIGLSFPYGPDGALLAALFGVPGALLASRRLVPRPGRRFLIEATMATALVGVLAASYRFTALIAMFTVVVLRLRRARPSMLWAGAATVAALCVLPVDVSLRMRPGAPRAVPTSSGCPTAEGGRMDFDGEIAIVGANQSAFYEPGWLVVW